MNKTWIGKLLNKKEVVSHVKLGKKRTNPENFNGLTYM